MFFLFIISFKILYCVYVKRLLSLALFEFYYLRKHKFQTVT
jgi:hypothetical protein